MVNKVRKLKNDFEKSDKEFSREVEEFADNCSEISEQVDKKVNVIVNIGTTITDIDKEFAKSTGILNRKDQVFLWTAVALQTIRWILLPVLKFDMPTPDIGGRKNANTGEEKKILQLVLDEFEDEDIENVDDGDNIFESKSNFIDKYSYFLKPVPYDAMTGEEAKKLNLPGVKTNPNSQLSGKTHHAATLGHDPVLGYFFGTINIMTYTITFHKIDLQTNEVLLLGDSWVKEIGSQVSFLQTLLDAIQAEMDDGLRIPFAVARHQIHMMTDEGTKMGLPIPFLSAAKQQSLLKKGWNSKELKKIHDSFMKYKKENNETIALQFFIADLINIIIKTLHLLMYDETQDQSIELYEVRTHKIINISNLIAESLNFAYVGGNVIGGILSENPEFVKKGIEKIDLGGYIECIHQIVGSKKLQEEIRREFVIKKMDEKVVGEKYNFMEETDE